MRDALVCLALGAPFTMEAQAARSAGAIEATWRLLEWRVGTETLRPPVVDGLWVVRDGRIMLQLRRTARDSVVDRFSNGHYTISNASFAYAYDRGLDFARPAGSAPTAHDTLPFAGTRTFRESHTGQGTEYTTADGQSVLLVRGDTLVYSEHGVVVRRWLRAR
jgi:hypothetical protein